MLLSPETGIGGGGDDAPMNGNNSTVPHLFGDNTAHITLYHCQYHNFQGLMSIVATFDFCRAKRILQQVRLPLLSFIYRLWIVDIDRPVFPFFNSVARNILNQEGVTQPEDKARNARGNGYGMSRYNVVQRTTVHRCKKTSCFHYSHNTLIAPNTGNDQIERLAKTFRFTTSSTNISI